MARRNRVAEGNVFRLDTARRVQNGAPVPADSGPQPAALSVALLAGSPLARDMMVHWLNQIASPCRVIAFADPAAFLEGAAGHGPFDLLLLGHCLQPAPIDDLLDGIRILQAARMPLVVVSDTDDPGVVGEALRHGVRGYIPTHLPTAVAAAAMKLVLSGGTYAPPTLPPARPAVTPASEPLPAELRRRLRLSQRESQVLRLLRMGCSNRQIAAELEISENTVMVHVRHLLRKLGVSNRTQAVYRAARLLEELD